MMKSKTKTELSKMTKKNLLLHIENMQLMIENDHLEAQKSSREMKDVLVKYKKDAEENKLEIIRTEAGRLRSEMVKLVISPEVKKKAMNLLDKFIDYL